MGTVNTPVVGLYSFPAFMLTRGNNRVPLFQELLLVETEAVNPFLLDTHTMRFH